MTYEEAYAAIRGDLSELPMGMHCFCLSAELWDFGGSEKVIYKLWLGHANEFLADESLESIVEKFRMRWLPVMTAKAKAELADVS